MWNKSNNLLIFIVFLIALEAILFLNGNSKLEKKQNIENERLAQIQKVFDAVPVTAKIFSVYDGTSDNEVYNKNGNKILPLASLSKIMTLIVASEKYKLNDLITISKKSTEESENNALSLGEQWKFDNLAKFTLITSSNSGALALAGNDKDFLEKMNRKTADLGMKNTIFYNFTGLDIDKERAGSYGTAEDVNIMALYALGKHPEIFGATIMPEITFKLKSGITHDVKNTDTIIPKIPNLLFSKTGFTTLAGGNLTVIFKEKTGHIIAITLLGSTFDERFYDMEKLVQIAYNLDYGNGK